MEENNIVNLFNSPEMKKFQDDYKKSKQKYEIDCDKYWNSLSYDDKLKVFYSVTKRIYQSDISDRGTYRWALYDVFGFEPDSYVIGMESGYFEIHNCIRTSDDIEEAIKKILIDSQLDTSSVDWDKWRERNFW